MQTLNSQCGGSITWSMFPKQILGKVRLNHYKNSESRPNNIMPIKIMLTDYQAFKSPY